MSQREKVGQNLQGWMHRQNRKGKTRYGKRDDPPKGAGTQS